MMAIAVLHKDEILKRVAKGDKITDIGKDYGISQADINSLILKFGYKHKGVTELILKSI